VEHLNAFDWLAHSDSIVAWDWSGNWVDQLRCHLEGNEDLSWDSWNIDQEEVAKVTTNNCTCYVGCEVHDVHHGEEVEEHNCEPDVIEDRKNSVDNFKSQVVYENTLTFVE